MKKNIENFESNKGQIENLQEKAKYMVYFGIMFTIMAIFLIVNNRA